jgi:DNA-binding transcriptional ArsR family regulator
MEERIAVDLLAALAQGMRLRIFRALVGAAPQGMTPGALSAMLGVRSNTLSFHLKEAQPDLPAVHRAHERAARPPHRALLPGGCLRARRGQRLHRLLNRRHP